MTMMMTTENVLIMSELKVPKQQKLYLNYWEFILKATFIYLYRIDGVIFLFSFNFVV